MERNIEVQEFQALASRNYNIAPLFVVVLSNRFVEMRHKFTYPVRPSKKNPLRKVGQRGGRADLHIHKKKKNK